LRVGIQAERERTERGRQAGAARCQIRTAVAQLELVAARRKGSAADIVPLAGHVQMPTLAADCSAIDPHLHP